MEYLGIFFLFCSGLFVGWLLTEVATRKKKKARAKQKSRINEKSPYLTNLKLKKGNGGYIAEITYIERFANKTEEKQFLVTPHEFDQAPLSSLLVQVGFHPIDVVDSFVVAEGSSANVQHPLFNKASRPHDANSV